MKMKMQRSGWYLVGGTVIAFILTIIIVYYVGYLGANAWNKGAKGTTCQVIDYESYGGNCWNPGFDGYYACWDVYIVVSYDNYTGTIEVQDDETNEQDALQDAMTQYPLGDELRCWYNPQNMTDVRLEPQSVLTYVVVLSVLGALFGVCLLGEFWLCCDKKKKKHKHGKEKDIEIAESGEAESGEAEYESTPGNNADSTSNGDSTDTSKSVSLAD